MAKKIIIPIDSVPPEQWKPGQVKQGPNWIRTRSGKVKLATQSPKPRGRPEQYDLVEIVDRSLAVIVTLEARRREKYLVAAAFCDEEFDPTKERENMRLRKNYQYMSAREKKRARDRYSSLLRECYLEYEDLLRAARIIDIGKQIVFLIRRHLRNKRNKTKVRKMAR